MIEWSSMPEVRAIIRTWLGAAGMGTLLGVAWAWLWWRGRLAHAMMDCSKQLPRWMFLVVGGDSGRRHIEPGDRDLEGNAGFFAKRLSILGMAATLLGFHYLLRHEFTRGLLVALFWESSFTLFLLLAWYVPVAELKRLLDKLPVPRPLPMRDSANVRSQRQNLARCPYLRN